LFGVDQGEHVNAFHLDGHKSVTDQVLHEERFSRYRFYRFANKQLEHLKTLSFVLACQINLVMLLSLEVSTGGDKGDLVVFGSHFNYASDIFKWLVWLFGMIQVCNAGAILAFLVMKNLPVAFKRQKRHRENYKAHSLGDLDDVAADALSKFFKIGLKGGMNGVGAVSGLGKAGAKGLSGLGLGAVEQLKSARSLSLSRFGAGAFEQLGKGAELGFSSAKGLGGIGIHAFDKFDAMTNEGEFRKKVRLLFIIGSVLGSVSFLVLRFGVSILNSVVTIPIICWVVAKACKKLREVWARPTNFLNFYYSIFYDLLSHPTHLFQICYVASTTLAVCLDYPMLYSFQLLDLIVMSPILQNVVKAVTKSAKQLSMTLLLGLLTVYVFAGVGFFFLQGEMLDTRYKKVKEGMSAAAASDSGLYFVPICAA
jgi:hypothetical protein